MPTVVMLVGLVAKNAILIVEFASEETARGTDPVKAAVSAARLRFRPIVMTSLAFTLGLLPLVFASGPGSAARRDIGTGVFFGMLMAITVGIVYVPFFFVMINNFTKRMARKAHGVLGHEADEHHEPDLEIDVVFEPAQPHSGIGAESRHGQRHYHGHGYAPAFVLCGEHEEHEQECQSEYHAGVGGLMFLLVAQAAPFHSDIVGKVLAHYFLQTSISRSGS